MRVKLSGGPEKGRIKDVSTGYGDRIQYQMMERQSPTLSFMHPDAMIKIRRGEYIRSHEKTKSGVPIYKWLGWMD